MIISGNINLKHNNMYSYVFILLIFMIVTVTPCSADSFETSNQILSDVEFGKIVTDATTIEPSCGQTDRALKSQEWPEQVKNIKISLNVDKFYRNVFSKLKNIKSGVGNQTTHQWFK